MLNSGEAKIFNFSRPGSLRDATLACICMGCKGGNPVSALGSSGFGSWWYIAFMNNCLSLWVTLRELDLACPKPFQMSEVPFFSNSYIFKWCKTQGKLKSLILAGQAPLWDATLDCICMGCEGGNPVIKWLRLMISAYIASMKSAMPYLFSYRYCPADIYASLAHYALPCDESSVFGLVYFFHASFVGVKLMWDRGFTTATLQTTQIKFHQRVGQGQF